MTAVRTMPQMIDNAEQDIGGKKQDIGDVLSAHVRTQAEKLRAIFGSETVFGRRDVIAVLVMKKLYDRMTADDTKRKVVETCVKAVEQLYQDLSGTEKLEKAKENIIAINGFDGSGVYVLTGSAEDASGEPVVLFELGHAAPAQSIR